MSGLGNAYVVFEIERADVDGMKNWEYGRTTDANY